MRKAPGPAHAFLEGHRAARLHISVVTAGELAAGPGLSGRPKWESLVGRFEVLVPDIEVAWRFGQAFRYLKDNGRLIGTNDLWIAATALAAGMPVVTRNASHYRRVPDLEVLGYR